MNTAAANTKNRTLFRLMMKLARYSSPVAFAPRGSERTGSFGGTGTLEIPVMFISFEAERLSVFMDVRREKAIGAEGSN